ncbi:MAG: hypothetical protein UR34_C0003G0020 [candidate division WS6 bacterium GW2011_GWC1_33_20]|uniref:Uncharacterized protein n=2 Tax=Candidatus Dojkabacteria TaxID=74243 RepID=A0A0G0AFA4_9BACT|nr:MAG: hypothetical protein UR32_C0003G0025 [candidate division WS6 bacterium GW2011_GWE2_33_157]KKP44394.1 MAG: hypothetical protein UR34_C0003G0020 [candidate division WS6 bacterium GW2011_GWC1_33_20]KKP46024.1 MAG: hypothetical protein UR36_C0002G0066 [candidate division WS6 bacterium GW2011_GWF1_33_233]KKP55464.1 MAG: hypothetical protein UR47_C0001G0025 [candidate division WS6 bacterium GW2011_GWB1_33_6]KKP55544.1 MAG: hypothetical protein UR45_C0001G0026 [candidate division WS6 bacterium
MKNILKKMKKYEGLGFVEALIALMVSGIVAVVLMSISASSIQELMRVDMQDLMAQYAVSTSVHIQKLAIEEANENADDNNFLTLTQGKCYPFNTDEEESIRFTEDAGSRNEYKDSSLVKNDPDFFRIMCVEYRDITDSRKMLVKIIVGSNKFDGLATTDRDIKDYEYFAVINI